MGMTLFFTLLFVGALGGLCVSSCSRSAKLARLAQLYGCSFRKRKTSVTTALSAGKLELFTQFFHQYRNIFTLTDHMAFIRLSDDLIFTDDKPSTKPIAVSLFTAEMRKTHFPTLKAVPISSPFAASQYTQVKTNLKELDNTYKIYAPTQAASMLLTPFVIEMLKKNPSVYLELSDNTLIYHEHTLLPPEKLEDFRFRAMQLLSEFETRLNHLENESASVSETLHKTAEAPHTAEERAQAMLHSFAAQRRPQANPPSNNMHILGLVIIFALFLAITFLSWFALHNWIGR